ncbi:general secretion pathway protein GspD [Arcobacter sp. CECT 8983]|uniref:type II secretion system protein GspD n=1 Tax=Arcobacter sp. CECT 8983 TaxID=2044508 RepID=UPI00100A6178|nr:secretin N-terminal domain-containing protein [Arcobacter sp. CECT 8983]RXJ90516.1 general secretion pathway protein GspD [Arcobacter sp. CECT 8983]
MRYLFLTLLLISFSFSKDKIDVNFNNLELLQLIKITSKTLGKKILVSQNIDAKVNFVSNEPISKDELLNILELSLQENGYILQEDKNILKVVKTKKAKKFKIKKEKIYKRKVEVVKLINLDAKHVQKILNKIIEKRETKDSYKTVVIYEESSNSLVLDGLEKQINSLLKIIKTLDKRKKQIYVKAKIVELDDYLLSDIGFKFGILGAKSYSSGLYTFSSNLNNGAAINFDTRSIGLEIPNLTSSLALGASLNLLNKTYALDIVSEPTLLCLNNIASSIYVGETISIQTGSTTTDGGTTKNIFEREDVGLTLKVKPRVDSNKVLLDIEAILEGIKNNNTNNNPDTSKKRIKTTAFVNNGESIVLGGLIEKKKEKTVEKIPYASDIPLLGELFKNRNKNNSTKNLIIIITPYIVPKNKDLTYVTNELAKIKILEDKLLEKLLLNLKKKKEKIPVNKNKNLLHEERLKNYFAS